MSTKAPAYLGDETSDNCSPNITTPTNLNTPSGKSEQWVVKTSETSTPPSNLSKPKSSPYQSSNSVRPSSHHLYGTTPSRCHFPIIVQFGNCQTYNTKPLNPASIHSHPCYESTPAHSHSKDEKCNTKHANSTPIHPIPKTSRPKHIPITKKQANAAKADDSVAVSSPTNKIGHELYHKKSLSRRHVNQRRRDLDRTGKACRKWEITRIQVKSLLGVEMWSYRAYRPLSERAFGKSRDYGEPGSGNVASPAWVHYVGASGLGYEEAEMFPNDTKDEGKVSPNEIAYGEGVNPYNTEGEKGSYLNGAENVENMAQ